VKDGTTYREYVDGMLLSQDSGPAVGTVVVGPLQFGSIDTGICVPATHQLVGFVDEIRLYDYALSSTQIQSIYEGKRKIFMNEP
jgi:hypothetical protein